MNQFLREQIQAIGAVKVLLLVWAMTLITVVVIWGLVQPEKTQGVLLTIGASVFGIFGTVVAVVFKKPGEGLTTKIRRVMDGDS